MPTKQNNFYYPSLGSNGEPNFQCLIGDSSTVVQTIDQLDYKHSRNYMMNINYEATDIDLIKFRDDLIRLNKQVMNKLYVNKQSKACFRVNIFNYNTTNEAILKNMIVNSDQSKIKDLPKIGFKEFCVFNKCLSAGLMTIDKELLDKPMKCYGYDFSKYYYQMMRKIRIPICEPTYHVIDAVDFTKLGFGIYRV